MEILRYAAFASDPAGGNPAGVVIDGTLSDEEMLRIASDVGYSETAFLRDRGEGHYDVRYFSPLAEVSFCGHATIASGVALAERHGPGDLVFHTRVGEVPVRTLRGGGGGMRATLTSIAPSVTELAPADLAELLACLGWTERDLDPALPPMVSHAGASHPILATASQQTLAALDYDFDRLGALMARNTWTTVDVVRRESELVFDARNPFPPGGVREDPATGAAAAALGGYLRDRGLVPLPATVTVHQGGYVGRPSILTVDIPADPRVGISVSGAAVAMEA